MTASRHGLHRIVPNRAALLVGSGISIASGLPSGMEFNRQVSGLLANSRSEVNTLEKLLVVSDEDRGLEKIRFEQLIALLRETGDHNLRVLSVFDADVLPNALHLTVAGAIESGAIALTTNFDSLIERAYYQSCASPLKIAFVESARGKLRDFSFRSLRQGCRQPVLLKLHGTLSLHTRGSANVAGARLLSSVGATLDAIGATTALPQLERYKHKALSRAIDGRTLIVIGYSGLDDFDVLPSLARALRNCSQVIWIRHSRGRKHRSVDPSTAIPKDVVDAARRHGVRVTVVSGRTDLIAQSLLPRPYAGVKSRPPARPSVHVDIAHPPETRAFIIGRLLQQVGRYSAAAQKYERSARLSRKSNNLRQLAEALEWLTSARFESGDLQAAKEANLLALMQWRSLKDRNSYATSLLDRARLRVRLGQIRSAVRDCARARDLLAGTEPALEAYQLEADYRRLLGEMGTARTLISSLLSQARKRRNRRKEASALNLLAQIEREDGRLAFALRQTRNARRLYRMIGLRVGVAGTYSTEGSIELDRGNARAVYSAYRSALAALRGSNRERSIAVAMGGIGVALRMLDRDRLATRYFERALSINQRLLNQEGIARDLENIALSFMKAGKFKAARPLLRRAKVIHERSRYGQKLAMTCCSLAECLRRLGRPGEARELLRRALRLNRSLKRRKGIASCLEGRAQIEWLQGRVRTATKTALASYAIASKDGFLEIVRDVAALMVKIANSQGETNQAIVWQQRCRKTTTLGRRRIRQS